MSEEIIFDGVLVTISYIDNHWYLYKVKETDDKDLDEDATINHFEIIRAHSKENAIKLIADLSDLTKLPKDGSTVYFRENYNPNSVYAVVVKQPFIRLFITQTSRFRGIKNLKVFKTYKDAMKWIMSTDIKS